MQQFQNPKSNQEGDNTNHDPPTLENEKKINDRMNRMEEMIRRARKMEELMDYDSLSLFKKCKFATQVQDDNPRQVWWDRLPKVPSKDVCEGYAAPRRGSTCLDVPKHTDRSRS